ncbi:MAG TPA: c-type cytochrome [Gemmatimonadaceae bacterium]|nr:c-type cytochrome [Gemmatimonadaceae bacterium]
MRFAIVLSLFALLACRATRVATGDSTAVATSSTNAATKPDTVAGQLLVAGDSLRLVEHPEILPAGFPLKAKTVTVRDPYAGNKDAIAMGGQLFVAYNCLDCHGADGSGAMAPSFQDGRWHFGGSPAEVFESIYQGRPDGMPAWGGRISNDQIWMLTAYVRSLASKDLSTENFTGKTVERTGH